MKKIFIFILLLSHFAVKAQDIKVATPLYVLDGKVINDIKWISPSNLEKIEVFKGKEAISKYGDAAKNGVIVMTSKPASSVPSRESLDPRVTELWDIKPAVITPGKNAGDAPSDAVVLFDGGDLSKWTNGSGANPGWEVKDGIATVVKGSGEIKTKQEFGDIQLHIEWRSPSAAEGDGQNRGNSGIFLQGQYELQVLDSYENTTYPNGQAGSIYKQHVPLVNASRKPGEWQVYDVVYSAPRFGEKSGRIISPAFITVFHNGVLIQNHVAIVGGTQYKGMAAYKSHGKGPLTLQDHGTPVSYRNIWVREL